MNDPASYSYLESLSTNTLKFNAIQLRVRKVGLPPLFVGY
jgi:hypothetical protein